VLKYSSCYVLIKNAGIAQPVEQLIRNQQVGCSSHLASSIRRTGVACPSYYISISVHRREKCWFICRRKRILGTFDMKYIVRLLKLVGGLFIFASGIVMIMQSNLGYGPWELFHSGLTNVLPITIGQATIMIGAIIVVADVLLKEAIGIGTVLNMVLMGVFLDLILSLNFIPGAGGIAGGVILIILGFFICAVGTWVYLSAGFGAGDRKSVV
jgi:hypothetical protein